MPYADPKRRREFERERSRRRTAERLARNLCPRCGGCEPQPGHAVCATCAEKRRAADRVRAAKRRAAGIGRVRNPLARKAEYRRARLRADERVAQGLCGKCGRHPHEPSRRLCADCGERQRHRDRERYARARDAGKLYGGKPVASKRLQACRRTRRRQRERRAAGLCIRCGRRRPVDGGIELRGLPGGTPKRGSRVVRHPAGCRSLYAVWSHDIRGRVTVRTLHRDRGTVSRGEKRNKPAALR